MIRWLALIVLAFAGPVHAANEPPSFQPRIGQQLSVDSTFIDSHGRSLTLAGALSGKPAILLVGYNKCPNMCGVTQQSVALTLLRAGLDPGRYRALFVSVDQHETAADASAARAKLADAMNGDGMEPWRFLTSPGGAGLALARQAGFEFDARERIAQFVHPVAIIALTPQGKIARVLPAATFAPRDLRLALVEASEGKLGSLSDQLYLLCAGFDATKGQYTPAIWASLQVAGIAMLCILAVAILVLARGRVS